MASLTYLFFNALAFASWFCNHQLCFSEKHWQHAHLNTGAQSLSGTRLELSWDSITFSVAL